MDTTAPTGQTGPGEREDLATQARAAIAQPTVPGPHTADEAAATSKRPTDHPGSRPAARPSKPRDPWPDNARLIAAVLIVVLHFSADLYARSGAVEYLYYATWPLRVPLYALIAGYFSSAAPLGARGALTLVRNVLGVYIVFDLIATVQEGLLGQGWYWDLGMPGLALWFLLALFFWRLSLPVVARIKGIVPISVVVALLGGFMWSVSSSFSISRALCFWPIFLLGWKLKEHGLHRALDRRWVRALAATFFVGYAVAVAYLVQHYTLQRGWMNMRKGYGTGPFEDQAELLVVRLVVIVLGMVGALAMLALTPRRRLPVITYLGSGSLYIYLLHPIVLKQVQAAGIIDAVDTRAELVVLLVGATALGLLLGSTPVRRVFRWIVQPRYTWLFHAIEQPARSAAQAPAPAVGRAPEPGTAQGAALPR